MSTSALHTHLQTCPCTSTHTFTHPTNVHTLKKHVASRYDHTGEWRTRLQKEIFLSCFPWSVLLWHRATPTKTIMAIYWHKMSIPNPNIQKPRCPKAGNFLRESWCSKWKIPYLTSYDRAHSNASKNCGIGAREMALWVRGLAVHAWNVSLDPKKGPVHNFNPSVENWSNWGEEDS